MDNVWAYTFDYGKTVRLNNEDGLEKWEQLVKKLQSKTFGVTFEWNPKCLTFYDQMIGDLQLIESDKGIDHTEWQKHHFLLQHGRIPHRNAEKPNLVRLFQVAYNAGQFAALSYDELYTHNGRLEYYNNNDLGNIETYCDRKQLSSLEK